MDHDALAQRLRLIAESAPGLRAAGVEAVEIDGSRVVVRYAPPFGPAESTPATTAPQPEEPTPEPEPDALDDPSTYEDGAVPGYEMDEEPA